MGGGWGIWTLTLAAARPQVYNEIFALGATYCFYICNALGSKEEAGEFAWLNGVPFKDVQAYFPKAVVTGVLQVDNTVKIGTDALAHTLSAGDRLIKGAPNYIMDKCTKYMDMDGQELPLFAAASQGFMDKVDELSEQALRVLAVATVKIGPVLPYGDDEDTDAKFAKLVKDCTFCGMCASIDPERDGVKDAVKTSRVAGVRVVMITGDYLKTAIAIAKNINILNKHTFVKGSTEALSCGDLRPEAESISSLDSLSNEEMDRLTSTTNVFARATPENQLEIVKSLQRQGGGTCMVYSDVPAVLRVAHIGVSPALYGSDETISSSDALLTDDNFCSIVQWIGWHRTRKPLSCGALCALFCFYGCCGVCISYHANQELEALDALSERLAEEQQDHV